MSIRKIIFLLIVIPLVVYFPSFFNEFVWDDEQFIYRNAYVATFDVAKIFSTNTIAGAGEMSSYYRPLTTLSFAIDYQFWKLHPFGYHVVNTMLHIASGILLFFILRKISISKRDSFWISLLFLLHPIQTEAVTYVNSRGDSLYTFFGLSSVLLFLAAWEKKNISVRIYNLSITLVQWQLFALSVVLYVFSFLSKEIGLAILGIVGLVLVHKFVYSQKQHNSVLKNVKIFLTHNIAAVTSFITMISLASAYLFIRSEYLELSDRINADPSDIYSNSLSVRLLTFTKIIFIYFRLLFVPYPLHMERSTELVTSLFSIWPILFISMMFSLVYLSWVQWKKQHSLMILLGLGWFFALLVPVSGILPINGMLYEHWLYLPMVGWLLILCGIWQLVTVKASKFVKYITVLVLIMYAMLTIRQNYFWSTPIRLYTYLLQHTASARIHNNLAMAYSEKKMYQQALAEYQKAIDFGYEYPQVYYNMGNTYLALQELDKAEKTYLRSIETNPYFIYPYKNLLLLYQQQKKYDQVLTLTKQAQLRFPEQPQFEIFELETLKSQANKQEFLRRKQELLEKYQTAPNLIQVINTITV